MTFANCQEADRALAEQVAQQVPGDTEPQRPLVLALPRGSVPIAVRVAERLAADLDTVVVRKIGAPGRPGL
jgi:predicted phosphoribosyltransferase